MLMATKDNDVRCEVCGRLVCKLAPDGLATIAFDRCAWLVDLRAYTCKCGTTWSPISEATSTKT